MAFLMFPIKAHKKLYIMGDSLGCLKVVLREFLCSGFSTRYSGFCHCCTGAKAFVWLDSMRHHRTDPTNAMIGVDISQSRSPWGVQVKQLTKICWHLICFPTTPDFLGKAGLNLALGLVTSCCSCQTV